MSDSVRIFGNEVRFNDLEEGQFVTDVIVLSRVVYHDDDGEMQDQIRITRTENTTQLLMTGIIAAANAIDRSAWSKNDD